jgi:cation transport protein ChaC
MMCLDRGGRCEGVLHQLQDADIARQLWQLLYREVGSFEALESVRWIDVETGQGPMSALAFYAHLSRLSNYAGNLPAAEIAKSLARACGHWGRAPSTCIKRW